MFYGIPDLDDLYHRHDLHRPPAGAEFALRRRARFAPGLAAGYRGACGIFTGDLILMLLSTVRCCLTPAFAAGLFGVMKFAGAAYLAWIGF